MLFDNKANLAENIKSQKTIIIVIKELFAVGDLSLGYTRLFSGIDVEIKLI